MNYFGETEVTGVDGAPLVMKMWISEGPSIAGWVDTAGWWYLERRAADGTVTFYGRSRAMLGPYGPVPPCGDDWSRPELLCCGEHR